MKKTFALFLYLLIPNSIYADASPNPIVEINYLLDFVTQSNCTINRNGSKHNGPKARQHIEKKYQHFKDDIKTTEDFIQYSATKSMLSGNNYTVSCPHKKTITTQQWLLDELSHFRKKHSPNNQKEQVTICTNPRPQICTTEYVPVCATLKNKTTKTYASNCSACADKKVISHRKNNC